VTVVVSPAEGSYEGQVEQRSYVVELPDTGKPRNISVIHKKPVTDYSTSYDETPARLPSTWRLFHSHTRDGPGVLLILIAQASASAGVHGVMHGLDEVVHGEWLVDVP